MPVYKTRDVANSKRRKILRFGLFPTVLGCLVCATYPWQLAFFQASSDSRLLYLLYVSGGLIGLVALAVSIHPPVSAQAKGLTLALFGLFFFLGFLVTSEQGARLEKASVQLKATKDADSDSKKQYDLDVRDFKSQLLGMDRVLVAISKNSTNNGWQTALSEVRNLEKRPVIGIETHLDPNIQLIKDARETAGQIHDLYAHFIKRRDEIHRNLDYEIKVLPPGISPESSEVFAKSYEQQARDYAIAQYRKLYFRKALELRNRLKYAAPDANEPPEFDGPYGDAEFDAHIVIDLQSISQDLTALADALDSRIKK